MNLTGQIAKLFRDVHYGNNWTSVNLKETLANVTCQQATTKVYSFNTIAALVYHMNYYVSAVLKVLEGGSLSASDKYSLTIRQSDHKKSGKNYWIKPGLTQTTLPYCLNNYQRVNFGKSFQMKSMGITTEIFTELLSIATMI